VTSRHVQAARLHNSKPVKASSTGEERLIRPGMSDWHIAVGQLVHRCAGDLAEHRSEPRTALAGRIIEWVNLVAKDTRVFGNLAKARAQITSMAGAYLFSYAPGPDAQYIGAELAFDGGRLDLAWFIPDLGIVVDELKTTAWVRLGVDSKMLEQAQRYRVFGVAEWGDMFAGVRFLPLLNPNEARFIDPTGDVARLTDSPARHVARAAA
jgi:hypothetical protein